MSDDTTIALSADKRSKILEAAEQRFRHYGVAKTTMRDIANDIGISVSNLYLYFENKHEIVLAIANNCRAEQELAIEAALSDKSLKPGKKLELLLLTKFRHIRAFKETSPRGPELIEYLIQEFPERLIAWQESLENSIKAILEEGVESGFFCVEDLQATARMMRIAIGQFFLPPYVELPLQPQEEELVELVRWLLSLITNPESKTL